MYGSDSDADSGKPYYERLHHVYPETIREHVRVQLKFIQHGHRLAH